MVEIAGKRYYTTQEIAEKLSLNIETVRRWIKSGKLKAKKIGRTYYIEESELLKLFEGNEKVSKVAAREKRRGIKE